jgi:tetratricopeptide (TPR) repeat protein
MGRISIAVVTRADGVNQHRHARANGIRPLAAPRVTMQDALDMVHFIRNVVAMTQNARPSNTIISTLPPFNMGVLLQKQGDYVAALEHFQQAISSYDGRSQGVGMEGEKHRIAAHTYMLIARCYGELNERNDQIRHLAKATVAMENAEKTSAMNAAMVRTKFNLYADCFNASMMQQTGVAAFIVSGLQQAIGHMQTLTLGNAEREKLTCCANALSAYGHTIAEEQNIANLLAGLNIGGTNAHRKVAFSERVTNVGGATSGVGL